MSQSLAGRTALLELLPLELEEIGRFDGSPGAVDATLWRGGYPRIHDRDLPAAQWLADYTAAYLERDVRSLLAVGDLQTFHTFLRWCAGRVGRSSISPPSRRTAASPNRPHGAGSRRWRRASSPSGCGHSMPTSASAA